MIDKVLDKKSTKEEIKKELKRRRERDSQMVKGIFRFHEVPGGTLRFVFKAYKEDPVERYDLVDGTIYTIPLGVALHLNTNVWYPQHAYQLDKDGKPQMQIAKKIRRASFQSLEFMDINENQTEADIMVANPL